MNHNSIASLRKEIFCELKSNDCIGDRFICLAHMSSTLSQFIKTENYHIIDYFIGMLSLACELNLITPVEYAHWFEWVSGEG